MHVNVAVSGSFSGSSQVSGSFSGSSQVSDAFYRKKFQASAGTEILSILNVTQRAWLLVIDVSEQIIGPNIHLELPDSSGRDRYVIPKRR
jgi:hypothetical protein